MAVLMRGASVWLLLVLAPLVLWSCAGKSLPQSSTRSTSSSTGGQPSDVPGFGVSSAHTSGSQLEKRLEGQLQKCAGTVAGHDDVAEAKSQTFEVKRDLVDLSVSSEVGVAPSAAAALNELAAVRSAHVRNCFSHYLYLLLQAQPHRGASVAPVSIASGVPPAPGAAGSFAWRITATYLIRRIPVSLYVDILGFVVGPARVTLVSFGALRPFPAGIQQRLYTLLLSRARAHSP
jgi:hypothetical protein